MSRPLVRAQPTIERCLRRLEQKLNDELGFRDQRLRFTKIASRNGPTTWTLRNPTDEAAGLILPQGSAAELAPAADDESILYFGYNEQWQPARGRDILPFLRKKHTIKPWDQTPSSGAKGNDDTADA